MRAIVLFLTATSLLVNLHPADAQSGESPALTVRPQEAIAGTFQTVTFTYTVGDTGMTAGGGIRLELPVAYGETEAYFWSKPQIQYRDVPGYVEAHTGSGDPLSVSVGGIAGGIATATLNEGSLTNGEKISLIYHGIVQSLSNEMHVRLEVRASDASAWQPAANTTFRILPREAHTIITTHPADIVVGEPFRTAVVVIDKFGNLATGYVGTVAISSTEPNGSIPDEYTFTPDDAGSHIFENVRFDKIGFQRITASDETSDLQVSSHYAWTWSEPPTTRRYFGDTHFHTGTGIGHNGFIGATVTGDINTLATKDFQAKNSGGDHRGNFTDARTAYRYARDVVRLDFASSSEHDAILFDSAAWNESREISESFYSPGHFTTLFAYEWTAGSSHHIVLYDRRHGKVFKRDQYPDLRSLWAALDEQGIPALTIPHVTWSFDDHPIWDDVNNTYRRVGEIYSLWNSRFLVQPDDIPQRFELGVDNRWSYQYAWHKGHRLGLVGATDNHLGRPGANNYTIYTHHTGGFAAVLASENTRAGIWEGLRSRRTYATTGTRIYLDFQADGHPMGSEYETAETPTISVRVAGTNRLETVEIVRYRNGEYVTVHSVTPDSDRVVFDFVDPGFNDGRDYQSAEDYMYYLRVKQVPEYPGRPWSHSTSEMAWSSPIWISTIPGVH